MYIIKKKTVDSGSEIDEIDPNGKNTPQSIHSGQSKYNEWSEIVFFDKYKEKKQKVNHSWINKHSSNRIWLNLVSA